MQIVPRCRVQGRAEAERPGRPIWIAAPRRPSCAPMPRNAIPFSRGNTPDKIVGAPNEKPAGPDSPTPAPPRAPSCRDIASKIASDAAPAAARPAGGSLGASLRNLQQFLQDQNYDNPAGRQADQNADIQFDSKGVEFGPWLRRFVAQVKRNWFVPQSVMFHARPRRHPVLRAQERHHHGPQDRAAVAHRGRSTSSALNSLKLSNPTMALPPEYPDDRAFFTVTFHYNEASLMPMRAVAVVGPTATGKSALGLAMARRFDGEIVACDSTAVYRGIDIGTDKVPAGEQGGIPHHLVDVAEPSETYSAARYARDAAGAMRAITARGRLPVIVGGTGFYYRALVRGLFPGPARDDELRARLTRVADSARARAAAPLARARRSGVRLAHPAARSEAPRARARGLPADGPAADRRTSTRRRRRSRTTRSCRSA